jgi:hypothetical protein
MKKFTYSAAIAILCVASIVSAARAGEARAQGTTNPDPLFICKVVSSGTCTDCCTAWLKWCGAFATDKGNCQVIYANCNGVCPEKGH